ncbi:MAG: hypothetical protein H7Z41_04485, partial [Cytophagales bacterium]|nr:hypothetical protein [Armatimonadota bacterium]
MTLTAASSPTAASDPATAATASNTDQQLEDALFGSDRTQRIVAVETDTRAGSATILLREKDGDQ